MKTEKTIECAREWVKAGKPCVFGYGWLYRGAGYHRISQEEAQKLIDGGHYGFGMGFYELSWLHDRHNEGELVLYFNELGENDLY